MQIQHNELDFTNQNIFVGIDVHKKNWKVNIRTDKIDHKTFTMDPEPSILSEYLRRNFPGGQYYSAYEAGFSGFWAHEQLEELGVSSIVVNPADIPTNDKQRRIKNDKVDCRKIAHHLRNGDLIGIYIPSRKIQEARTLLRLHYQITKDQTRLKNQIKSILNFYGYSTPSDLERSHWSNRYIQWLKQIEFQTGDGRKALDIQIERLISIRQKLTELIKELRKLGNESQFKDDIKLLMSICGIGILTAMYFLLELVDIKRFKNINKLCGYFGLYPGEDSTGENVKVGRITKRGRSHLRYMLIEASWIAIRKDPALMMSFNTFTKTMSKQKAIIKIARKLLNRIYSVMKHKKPYVIGVVK